MLQWVAIATAAFLVLAALLLVANTIRLAAFARRKEIGIMRLVGASTLYIALPFLLEALVDRAHRRAARRGGAGGVHVLRDRAAWPGPARSSSRGSGSEQYGVAVIAVAVLGPLLTVLPTLVLTRKYLKV